MSLLSFINFFLTRNDDPDWGTYYEPTLAGYTLAIVLILLLVLCASLIAGRRAKHRMGAKELAFCAIALALAYVTSTFIKLVHMPMGGSITLFSMLFVTMIGYWYGLRTGLTAAMAYGLLQLVTGPWIISMPQLLCDYILAFGALGLSGIFSGRRHGLILGYVTGVAGRFVFSFLSGMIFFASSADSWHMSAPLYSFCYNGAYIGGEAALTLIFLAVPSVRKALDRVKVLSR